MTNADRLARLAASKEQHAHKCAERDRLRQEIAALAADIKRLKLVRYGQIAAMRERILAAVPVGEGRMLSAEAILRRENKRATNSDGVLARTTTYRVLAELAGTGAVVRTVRHHDGPGKLKALSRRKLVLFHRPPKHAPRVRMPGTPPSGGQFCPQVSMIVSPWRKDRLGLLSRTVRAVDADQEMTGIAK
jgi:alkylated DNA nucleotide flippase Atl1